MKIYVKARGKLRQSLLTFMASQMITEKEKDELQRTFQSLDKNGDGTLSQEELVDAFRSAMTDKDRVVENIDDRIKAIIDRVDFN